MQKSNVMRGTRLYGLDFFRIALGLLVFMFHSRMHIGCSYGMLNPFVETGAIAMTGYFILSGYVLAYKYMSIDMTNLGAYSKFIVKRITCLWPSAIVVGLGSIVLAAWSGSNVIALLGLTPIEFLGLASIYDTLFPFPPNGGLWFVSCIFICYLLFPQVSKLIFRMPQRIYLVISIILTFVLLYSPFVVKFYHCQSMYTNPIIRFMEFTVGIITAAHFIRNSNSGKLWQNCWRLVVVISALSLLVIITLLKQYFNVYDCMMYNLIVLPAIIAILYGLSIIKFDCNSVVKARIIRYASDVMYCFFLGQFFCFSIVRKLSLEGNSPRIIVSFLSCAFIAIILYEVMQKRIGGRILTVLENLQYKRAE